MNPFVLELVCRELRMTEGAVIELKRQLRLARNNQARLRRENANLRVQVFNQCRDLRGLSKELADYVGATQAIASTLKMLNA